MLPTTNQISHYRDNEDELNRYGLCGSKYRVRQKALERQGKGTDIVYCKVISSFFYLGSVCDQLLLTHYFLMSIYCALKQEKKIPTPESETVSY